MTEQTIILFGPSGSGKGTQARLLIEEIKKLDTEKKVLYLETGDKLREFSDESSATATLTKDALSKGELLPEFLPIWIWTEYFVRHISGDEHLILDGSPRKLEEASILDSAIKFYKRENPIVISIEITPEEARKRLLGRGRSDDNERDITERLSWYDKNVRPAINYFKENSYYKFIAVDGNRDIEEVSKDILEKIQLGASS